MRQATAYIRRFKRLIAKRQNATGELEGATIAYAKACLEWINCGVRMQDASPVGILPLGTCTSLGELQTMLADEISSDRAD